MNRKLPGIHILKSGKQITIDGKLYPLKKHYQRLSLIYQGCFCVLAAILLLLVPDILPLPFWISLILMILTVMAAWWLLPILPACFLPKDIEEYVDKG